MKISINWFRKYFRSPVFSETARLLEQVEIKKTEWQEAWLGFRQSGIADNDYWIFNTL